MISMNERLRDPSRQQENFFSGRQAMLWTSLPGIVQSFDPGALTCEVQPAIMGKVMQEDGTVKAVNLPLLLDCPVVFPHAGGCALTFPVKPGDECLIVFSCRAIDLWWQSGGVQPPAETRMHDLSDGFVIVGPFSQPKTIPDVSTSCVELRSADRQARISIDPTSHAVQVVTSGTLSGEVDGAVSLTCGSTLTAEVTGATTLKCPTLQVDCPQTTFTGNVTVQGLINGTGGFTISGGSGAAAKISGSLEATGDVTAGSISLQTHVHTDQGDGNDTSAPK